MTGQDFAGGIGAVSNALIVVSFVSVPLAVWKLVEIIIWMVNHVSIGLK